MMNHSRRRLFKVGFLGGLGMSLAQLLRTSMASGVPARAKACIFIHLRGGPSHLDTLDMKPDAPLEERGEFKRIQTVIPGYHVCEHLPRLAKWIDRFTLIRGISHAAGAHPLANEYLYTGNRSSPALIYPSLGAVSAKELSTSPAIPPFVAIPHTNMSPGYLGVGYGAFQTTSVPKRGKPFAVRGLAVAEGLSPIRIQARNDLLRDLDQTFRQMSVRNEVVEGLARFSQQAHEMIMSDDARRAFDVNQEATEVQALFADDDLSQSLLLAGRLVEHGVRFVNVGHDGWDTHIDNFINQKNKLLPQFDAGITALVQMLELKGQLDDVLIVATGEFGRTPKINKQAGRDHWPQAMWTLLAGGGTKRGFFLGGTDSQGHSPDANTELKPDDLAATIYHALGIDPMLEYLTPAGRPLALVPEGTVLHEVFA